MIELTKIFKKKRNFYLKKRGRGKSGKFSVANKTKINKNKKGHTACSLSKLLCNISFLFVYAFYRLQRLASPYSADTLVTASAVCLGKIKNLKQVKSLLIS